MFFAKPLQRSNLCASHRQRRWLTHGELTARKPRRPTNPPANTHQPEKSPQVHGRVVQAILCRPVEPLLC